MVKCSFSGKDIPKGKGTMFVKKDGTVLWFFNSKCEKNYFLKRKARETKWTNSYNDEKAKRLKTKSGEKSD